MRKIRCEACPGRANGTLCNVPPEALGDFGAMGATSIYRARQVIFTEGTPCAGLYIVCRGAVKLYHSDRFGRDHILEVAGPGAILGDFSAAGTAPMSVSAETLTEGQLTFLPRERLVPFLQRYPDTALSLLEGMGRQLAATRRKVRDLALKRAENRLASLLLQLAAPDGDGVASGVELAYTRRELAEMIGVSTETVIRLLSKLKAKQAIAIRGRSIAIRDPAKLREIATWDEI